MAKRGQLTGKITWDGSSSGEVPCLLEKVLIRFSIERVVPPKESNRRHLARSKSGKKAVLPWLKVKRWAARVAPVQVVSRRGRAYS